MITIIVFCFNIKKKEHSKQEKIPKNLRIMVSLKYVINFWRTPEMPLINCEISLILTWSKNCLLVAGTLAKQEPTLRITNVQLYVQVVT